MPLPDSQTANEAPITMEPQIVGPMMPQDASAFSLPEPEDEDPQEAVSLESSNIPYSEYRSRLRELTYPTVPKMDFAPSPPGSPAQQVTAKVKNILRLKKNDVHFNFKMEQSSAFHNPAISQKLMAFAEIDEKQGQYATVLTKALWDPTKFPDWAYITPLYEAARLKPRPAGRAPVFISAESSKTTYQPPQTSSAGGLAKRQKRKAESN
ncbi:hypothetical protein Cpir12675_005880 [Ceratocystis pirilliformis]|uniref:Uncharacterized protein n=1 Tax=Ceratocystis pirilliformis TaxID=259994 RepID=A0ABR3YM41_9PEZI